MSLIREHVFKKILNDPKFQPLMVNLDNPNLVLLGSTKYQTVLLIENNQLNKSGCNPMKHKNCKTMLPIVCRWGSERLS